MSRPMLIVGFALFVAFLGSNIPAPLYELYGIRFGASTFAMTVVFAVYPLALVATLIGFARLPDLLGRRPVMALGVAVAGLGSIVFALASGVPALVAARLCSAASIGLISAAAAPALVELDPAQDRRRAALVATFAASLACGVAPFGSGLLAVLTGKPFVLPYLVHVALCIVCVAVLRLVPETRRPSVARGGGAALRLAGPALRAFVGATFTSGITWWLASLFVSILPAFVGALLGVHSPAVQGALALIVFVVSPLAQTFGRAIPDRTAARAGLIGTAVALAMVLGAVPAHSLVLLAAGSVIAGVAHGLGFLGAQSLVNRLSPPAARARLSATFYAVTYVCIGIPILAVGALTASLGVYGALAAVGAVVALAAFVLAATLPRTVPAYGEQATDPVSR